MRELSEFRWKIAVAHAALALVLVVIVVGALALNYDVADPNRFGEGVGRLSVFAVVSTLGVSWLSQTGRKRLAAVLAGRRRRCARALGLQQAGLRRRRELVVKPAPVTLRRARARAARRIATVIAARASADYCGSWFTSPAPVMSE